VEAAKNVLRLFLAKQAIDGCAGFSSGKILPDRIRIVFADSASGSEYASEVSDRFARHHKCGTLPAGNCSRSAYNWLRTAANELNSGNTDLIVAIEPETSCSVSSFFQTDNDSIVLREGICAVALQNLESARDSHEKILAVFAVDESGEVSVANPGSVEESIDPEALRKQQAIYARIDSEDLILGPDQNCLNLPFNDIKEATKTGAGSACLNWKKFRKKLVGKSNDRRFLHDLLSALFGTFVSRISVQNPIEFMKAAQKPVIYVANHQIGLESPLFMTLAYAVTGLPVQAVAKPDHIDAWLSFLMEFAQDSLEPPNPFSLIYFDRNNPQGLIDELKASEVKSSLLIHVDGTRSKSADVPAAKISSIFLDLAISKNIPLVPVRFVGGLPAQPVDKPLDFPFQNGKQDYLIGTPIYASQLSALPYGQRPKMVLEKINSLGPKPGEDLPLAPDKEFTSRTAFFKDSFKLPTIQAMLFAILQGIDDPCDETSHLIRAVQSGKLSAAAASDDFPPVLKKFLVHMKTKFASQTKSQE
ncbi:MAG: lysophospholipid acyltransferase family protein, partial [Candidatus Rifleibacteriota bacterium]